MGDSNKCFAIAWQAHLTTKNEKKSHSDRKTKNTHHTSEHNEDLANLGLHLILDVVRQVRAHGALS